MCFSVFSFCITYCVWALLFTGCRFVVPVVFAVCPHWLSLVQWVVLASWWRVLVPVFWWMRLDLVFLVGMTPTSGVFWGVCELIMILCRLSANGWGCVPVLLVVWHRVSSTVACCLLSGAGSYPWDGDLWESFHHLVLCGAGRSLVDQCPELSSPTSEAQAWHPAGAPRPCQPHGRSTKFQKLDNMLFWQGCGDTVSLFHC